MQDNAVQSRKLRRARQERVIAGVAGGIANYINVDPLFVRAGFIVLGLLHGLGAVIYLLMWLLMPNEDTLENTPRDQVRENIEEMQQGIQQSVAWVCNLFKSS